MKIIRIVQGDEFNYKVGDVDDNDIFKDEFDQAALRLEDIVTATKNSEGENKTKESDYLNNIIAFTGERGQGKSSAMHSFSQDLLDFHEKKSSKINYKENTKKAKFRKLDTIDPSTFENMHNVLEVVIARMYNDFEKKYKYSGDDNFRLVSKNLKILESFQKVYESLSFLRNPKKLEDLECDFEGSIQKIARIGDSANLQKEMITLVDSYLEIFIKDAENRFLIIPIDDLDINIEYAYKISEQIRKYLTIPHVIIIMAVKIEQLKQCVEKEYRKQLAELISAPDRLNNDEPTNMAAKYVEKFIPDGRKISLPEIRAISQSGKDAVKLIFEKGKDKDDNTINILDKYKSNNEIPENELGIEKTLLAFIYDKTGIVFIKPEFSVHPIIPNTMRELVNLISVLGKMGDSEKSDVIDEIKLQNIKLFEDYYMHTWVPANLDDGNIRTINQLWHTNTFEKHQFICLKIMDIIENLNSYTTDDKIIKDVKETSDATATKFITRGSQELKVMFSKKNSNCLSYTVGDVVSLLELLSSRFINNQIANLVFAVKTLYTITMHKLAYPEQSKMINNMIEPNDIYKFVGGDLWGPTKKAVIRSDRGLFTYNPQNIFNNKLPGPTNNLDTKTAATIAQEIGYMTFWANYPSIVNHKIKKDNYGEIVYLKQFVSRNGHCKEEIEFAIDNLFISPLDLHFTYTKSGLQNYNLLSGSVFKSEIESLIDCKFLVKIAVNYELNECIKKHCRDTNDTKDTADSTDYATFFNSKFHDTLKKIDYISYFKNEYYVLPASSLLELIDKPTKLGQIFVKFLNSTLKGPKESDNMNENAVNKKPEKIISKTTTRIKFPKLLKYIDTIKLNIKYYKDKIDIEDAEDIEVKLNDLSELCGNAYDANPTSNISEALRDKYNEIAQKVYDKIEEEVTQAIDQETRNI